ncbi:DUF6551 family protein [Aurantiacibacter luteus]|uniref:DUF6551 family protein n=1 Tax=Aurantiacibacter luteus TaxID=1581420 RepID=UPI00069A4415|nr:DUF6551 family protein [Aurantiacibacter luteus]
MPRSSTARLKLNPPLGHLPALQWGLVGQLQVDAGYQRSVVGGDSQALIRRIAQHWNWDLCQPLVVSRRADGSMWVIDGQHRLEGAKLRGDIHQLPCVVVDYACREDEAASFVHLNQQRRPLSKLDLFKAAVASEDAEACAIAAAIATAGLELAPHMNASVWKPGMLANIGGIEGAWRKHGALVTGEALQALATAFAGEVLQYAGTLFPGVVAVCVRECRDRQDFEAGKFAAFTAKLGSRGQKALREDILLEAAADEMLGRVGAAVRVVTELWQPDLKAKRHAVKRALGEAVPVAAPAAAAVPSGAQTGDKSAWCDQCDARRSLSQVAACVSPFCSFVKAA